MNVKINREQFDYLLKFEVNRYLFGSQLHGIASKDSDFDYVVVLTDEFYKNFKTEAKYLPNVHSYQFDDEWGNTQYVVMTETQFYRGLFSGDGNNLADIVLLSGKFNNPKFLCSGYKVVKGYLGVSKRDLKLHPKNSEKKFHALRSMYMAESLMNGEIPTVEDIKLLYENYGGIYLPTTEALKDRQESLRNRLNKMLDNGEIDMYPKFEEENELVQIIMNSNNIKEFRYD